ncbi:uncharacterized protein JCM15063_004739 [Sporobolomyces koalae]|uniref:uncharacterized protein n=1 Tax=Sporobolomyces koalae TaxID=500713 RepID=UPI003181FA9E
MAPTPRGSASGQTFPCSQCDKTFSRKEYMARHFRSKHSKEKPFSCEYCSHGFSRSDLLRRHYKTCSEAKALGVSGPPPGADKHAKQPSSRPKAKRKSSTEEPSIEPIEPDSSPMEQDDLVLPTPPEVPIASTSGTSHSTVLPNPLSLPPGPLRSYQEPPQLVEPSPHVPHPGFYPPPPPHPYALPHYNLSPTAYNPYSHSPYYHPYAQQPPPQQYPGLPPPHIARYTHNPSDALSFAEPEHESVPVPESIPAESTSSAAIAAESLTQYLRQHHQSLQHQPQPAPLPAPQPAPLPMAPTIPAHSSASPPHEAEPIYPPPTSSPSSAFRIGTATNDTLAPGLSGTGSFSADEVLASEVLRDLMRSPAASVRPGMSRENSDESANGNEAVIAPTGEVENLGRKGNGSRRRKQNPPNAVLAGNHQNSWGLMGGYNGLGSTRANTPIEESPAALALADYFNKGGVGGITALDLGFPTEPDLYPDWLLNPRHTPFREMDKDRRFEIPEQMFHMGYSDLFPWHVPPSRVLSQYAKRATESLLPSVPVFHAPSVDVHEMALHGAFALTVAGGAFEDDGQVFSNEMLVEKRVFLIRGFMNADKNWDDQFASIQSLLLYQLLGFFHRDEQQRLLSHQFHSSLIFMLKHTDLPGKIQESDSFVPPPKNSSPEVVERAWKEWVQIETWKRVAFIVFLTDLEHSIATGAPQFVLLSDMDINLPSSERAWAAENAADWHRDVLRGVNHPTTSFLAAVRALLAPDPQPFSEHSMVLAELSRLSSFPLLILARMLSYMDKKCEEALQQVDPFKPLLGGLGMAASREQENRSMLVRIRKGREILRGLPGGLARGGGERWFQDTMPGAFGGEPRSGSSSTAGSTNPRASPVTTTPSDDSSLNTPPQDTYRAILSELELEELYGRDPNVYKPVHGEGGARPGETYHEAQERLRKLREDKIGIVNSIIPGANLLREQQA